MLKRSVTNGFLPRPKPGVWPPPVYEAHYIHTSDCGNGFPAWIAHDFSVPSATHNVCAPLAVERTVRMSFWSPAGKPIDATRRRELMLDTYYAKGAQMTAGYVCQGTERTPDWPVQTAEKPKNGQRVTAKLAKENLGRLLACLDGSITDHDEIRNIVIECRKLAA